MEDADMSSVQVERMGRPGGSLIVRSLVLRG